MHFTIKKELVENRYMPGYGRLEFCSMFTVTEAEKNVGRFFYSDEVSFLAFGERDIRINYVRKLLRQTLYPIVDQKDGQAIGGYDRRDYTGPSTPFGKLFLGDSMYLTQKTAHTYPKNDKQQHITIWVGNIVEAATYHIRVNKPTFFSLRTVQVGNSPFEGEIELHGNNLLLLFAGIFLVQQVLEFEDGD
jgi:hypothetical protein